MRRLFSFATLLPPILSTDLAALGYGARCVGAGPYFVAGLNLLRTGVEFLFGGLLSHGLALSARALFVLHRACLCFFAQRLNALRCLRHLLRSSWVSTAEQSNVSHVVGICFSPSVFGERGESDEFISALNHVL